MGYGTRTRARSPGRERGEHRAPCPVPSERRSALVGQVSGCCAAERCVPGGGRNQVRGVCASAPATSRSRVAGFPAADGGGRGQSVPTSSRTTRVDHRAQGARRVDLGSRAATASCWSPRTAEPSAKLEISYRTGLEKFRVRDTEVMNGTEFARFIRNHRNQVATSRTPSRP